MKKLLLICLLLAGLMLSGCQSSALRWANTDMGLPQDCVRTLKYKDSMVQYCLVPADGENMYYFEGIMTHYEGAHSFGRIAKATFKLELYKGDDKVYSTILTRRGDRMDKPIYLNKDFQFDGEFDDIWISYSVSYRF